MAISIRKATDADAEQLAELIRDSVRGLAPDFYNQQQIDLSISTVFGIDTDLIADGTYFVAEIDGELAGCGGWSMRKTLYGASIYAESRDPELLDPKTEAAKIRAFFVHPRAARRGVGTALLEMCEREILENGFSVAEMMSTMPGVPLYAAKGYTGSEHVEVPVGNGITITCVRMSKDLKNTE